MSHPRIRNDRVFLLSKKRRFLASLWLIVSAAFVLSGATRAWAWGCEGHEVVALIAQKHLTHNASLHVEELLKAGSELDTPTHYCPPDKLTKFAVVSTWADDYRQQHRDTGPWHFRNIPLDAAGPLNNDAYCPDNPGCVTKAIATQIATLKGGSSTTAERNTALIFLIHFVGDLHQPLHCEDNADLGGNCIPVTYGSEHPKLDQHGSYIPNLHGLWDNELVEVAGGTKDPEKFANDLDVEYSQEISTLLTQPASQDALDAWSWDSHEFAVSVGYGDLPAKIQPVASGTQIRGCSDQGTQDRYLQLNEVIDDKYSQAARPVIRQQLARAGARLAHILNDIWPD